MKNGLVIDFYGTKRWYKNDLYHREDGPALEYPDGTKFWFKEGNCHQEDGPAIEYSNGAKYWYKEGKLHREDGPAVEYPNGEKHWYYKNLFITSESQIKFEKILKLTAFM